MINNDTIKALSGLLGGRLRLGEPMSLHTTFKTGGAAALFLMPKTEDELASALRILKESGVPYYIMGNGSNLLVSDAGYAGAVVRIGAGFDSVGHIGGTLLYAGAGTLLSAVCAQAQKAGLCGLEFAAGIPGTLGGGITMNAGAYGGELKDFVEYVRVLTPDLQKKEIPNKDMQFSYRKSNVLQKGYIILGAGFVLPKGDVRESQKKVAELNTQRRAKQPLGQKSAGSTFKRPEGHYAGVLIEQCGLKGCNIGGAQVSELHAGFIINTGGATSMDIYQLIMHVRRTVHEQTGVMLEPEVKLLGEFPCIE
ncbi:MAG: UDP-N-acetylmuramate dehydrogenase [Christensenellaceae bacterium]|jgi:UDP-N-acetylmuramate dehydrogenase